MWVMKSVWNKQWLDHPGILCSAGHRFLWATIMILSPWSIIILKSDSSSVRISSARLDMDNEQLMITSTVDTIGHRQMAICTNMCFLNIDGHGVLIKLGWSYFPIHASLPCPQPQPCYLRWTQLNWNRTILSLHGPFRWIEYAKVGFWQFMVNCTLKSTLQWR